MFSDVSLFFFFFGQGYNNVGSSNFGWNLGAPAAAPMPTMPMPYSPSPYDSSNQDNGEPGVQEVFSAKSAGAMSFAHYIVKWVSVVYFIVFYFYYG